jgi:hypothetical protein
VDFAALFKTINYLQESTTTSLTELIFIWGATALIHPVACAQGRNNELKESNLVEKSYN